MNEDHNKDRVSIAPLLSVRHGTKAIEFYKRALGAEERFRVEDEKGEVVVRFSVGGADFWIADESPPHANFSPETLGGSSVRMVVIVDAPDELFERVIAAGANVVSPMTTQHGWRIGRLVDPFGHHWEIGKPL
jgi:PhnB protein